MIGKNQLLLDRIEFDTYATISSLFHLLREVKNMKKIRLPLITLLIIPFMVGCGGTSPEENQPDYELKFTQNEDGTGTFALDYMNIKWRTVGK